MCVKTLFSFNMDINGYKMSTKYIKNFFCMLYAWFKKIILCNVKKIPMPNEAFIMISWVWVTLMWFRAQLTIQPLFLV